MGQKNARLTLFAVTWLLGLNETMSNRAAFSVETSPQKALIVGEPSPLLAGFSSALKQSHLELTNLSLEKFMDNPPLDLISDFDYLVILADSSFLSWLTTPPGHRFWTSSVLRSSSLSRFFLIAPLVLSAQLPPPEDFLRISLYGEFYSAKYSEAPTLENFLSEAKESKTLTIPGDGLQAYHLLHLDDLLQGLISSLFSPSSPPLIYLLNPSSLSLLSLAYRLRSSLPQKTAILFNENLPVPVENLDWENVLEGQAEISWSPEQSLETELPLFINNYLATPHHAPPHSSSPPPPSPAPHLSPLSSPLPPSSSLATSKLTEKPTSPSLRLQPLKTLLQQYREKERQPKFVLSSKPKKTLKTRPLKIKHSHPVRRLVVHSLAIALALYLVSLGTSLLVSYLSVRSLVSKLQAGNYNYSRSLTLARTSTIYLEANLFVLHSFPGLNSISSLSELNSLVLAFHQGLDVLDLATPLINTSQTLFAAIFSDQQIDLNATLSLARLQVADLYQSLALFDGVLADSPPTILPSRYSSQYSLLKTSLQMAKHQTLVAKTILQITPDLIGVGDRLKYAILFQNNMELRPTGGFIGSFALPSFENGKLYDLPIFDVYSADGQLKGHVEPPAPIKKYLGEANWFLRDSNWDPDFPTSARRAEWFLNKTINENVEGVIAIDLETLKEILHALGSVTLPDYNEEISEDNLFSKAEYYSEVNFFPGSTQKKEFLSSVTTSLLAKLPDLSRDQSLALALALLRSIDQKNTLISLSDPNLNATFSLLGWNGELRDPPCPFLEETACFNDYAMLVDSNLGVNKANYFLDRKLDLVITIDKELLVSHRLTTTYLNTATSTAWPAGSYKNYSRLYLPQGSVLEEVLIDGKKLDPQELTIYLEHNRLVVGFLVEVPISSTVVVETSYQVGVLSNDSPAYTFYWQKQSGTESDPLTIFLNYPLFLVPAIVSPSATLNQQQLQFNLTNVTDRRVTVQF